MIHYMATKTEIKVTCDVCSAEGAKGWTISGPPGSVTIDLCPEHAAPLEGLPGKWKKRRQVGAKSTDQLTVMEQEFRQYKEAPAKAPVKATKAGAKPSRARTRGN